MQLGEIDVAEVLLRSLNYSKSPNESLKKRQELIFSIQKFP